MRAELKDWYVFSGNELGVLLGYWEIQRWKRNNPSGEGNAAVLASIVSSRMLKAIAQNEGLIYNDTLTGMFVVLISSYCICTSNHFVSTFAFITHYFFVCFLFCYKQASSGSVTAPLPCAPRAHQ